MVLRLLNKLPYGPSMLQVARPDHWSTWRSQRTTYEEVKHGWNTGWHWNSAWFWHSRSQIVEKHSYESCSWKPSRLSRPTNSYTRSLNESQTRRVGGKRTSHCFIGRAATYENWELCFTHGRIRTQSQSWDKLEARCSRSWKLKVVSWIRSYEKPSGCQRHSHVEASDCLLGHLNSKSKGPTTDYTQRFVSRICLEEGWYRSKQTYWMWQET